jgi:extradiol dioxygenase family protein
MHFSIFAHLKIYPHVGDEVPVPHTGLALTVEQFHELAARLKEHGIDFIIEPHLRFVGMPGEQFTMFFKDPSGNNLEFKAMTKAENLFAKYNVVDK